MNNKKNGFIATALIYPFYLTILLMLTFLLNSYSRVAFDLREISKDIRDEEPGIEERYADVNAYIYARESESDTYISINHLPGQNYTYDNSKCYTLDGEEDPNSTASLVNNEIVIRAKNKTVCKLYFTKQKREADIVLNIYVNDIDTSVDTAKDINYNLLDAMPSNINDYIYVESKTNCVDASNNKLSQDIISLNDETDYSKGFQINATEKTICNVYFINNK